MLYICLFMLFLIKPICGAETSAQERESLRLSFDNGNALHLPRSLARSSGLLETVSHNFPHVAEIPLAAEHEYATGYVQRLLQLRSHTSSVEDLSEAVSTEPSLHLLTADLQRSIFECADYFQCDGTIMKALARNFVLSYLQAHRTGGIEKIEEITTRISQDNKAIIYRECARIFYELQEANLSEIPAAYRRYLDPALLALWATSVSEIVAKRSAFETTTRDRKNNQFTGSDFVIEGPKMIAGIKDRLLHVINREKGTTTTFACGQSLEYPRPVALSTDGKTVATREGDASAFKLWDVASEKCIARVACNIRESAESKETDLRPFRPSILEFSNDGKIIAAIGSCAPHLFDAQTGELVRVLRKNKHRVSPRCRTIIQALTGNIDDEAAHAIAFSPDDTMIASAYFEPVLWNGITGKPLHSFHGSFPHVLTRSLAINPGNSLLAAATDDNRVRIWNIADKTLQRVMHCFGYPIFKVAFADGGKRLTAKSFRDLFVCRIAFQDALINTNHAEQDLICRALLSWSEGRAYSVQQADRATYEGLRKRNAFFDERYFILPGTGIIEQIYQIFIESRV